MTAKLVQGDSEIFLDGPHYIEALKRLHATLKPKRYFEIGTFAGDTLRLARRSAVAVDPEFRLPLGAVDAERVKLREMTSDQYFALYDLKDDIGGEVDLAFLDGMHQFSFLLRDFINTERCCGPTSAIVMHDCLPRNYYMARPPSEIMVEQEGGIPGWTGDVWKMIPILRQYRPDLEITCLDAEYTGLVICRHLNSQSTTLSKNYEAIITQWENVTLQAFGLGRLLAHAHVERTNEWIDKQNTQKSNMDRWKRMFQPRRIFRVLTKILSTFGGKAHG